MTKSILKHSYGIRSDKSLSSSSSTAHSSSSSSSSSFSSSFSSRKSITKNVRFDLFSTTIKRFDSDDEPITISTESSPIGSPILNPDTNYSDNNNYYNYNTKIYNPNDGLSNCNHHLLSNSIQNNNNNNTNKYSESCWFNNLDVLPNLINFDKKFYSLYKKNKFNNKLGTQSKEFYKQNDLSLSDFDLDYDDDDDDVTISNLDNIPSTNLDSINNNSYSEYFNENTNRDSLMYSNDLSLISDVDIKWKLIDSNVPLVSKSLDFHNNSSIESYLNGQNIKLYKLEQSNLSENKLYGYLIVNNINFEKIIEIKFTFNNWDNIHYINSTYNKSLTSKFDEFQFVIDLNCYKFFLQIKNLLDKQIKIDLCCRYDVGNETYFDNNNYQNYTLTLTKLSNNNNNNNNHSVESYKFSDTTSSQYMDSNHFPIDNIPPLTSKTLQKNINNPKNITGSNNSAGAVKSSTTKTNNNRQYSHPFLNNNKYIVPMTSKQFLNNRHMTHSRTFSDDTDYYNTSPLKHLYHNDTCQFVKKPATINEVLNIENNPLPLPDTLPEPSISITKSNIDLLNSLSQQSDDAKTTQTTNITNQTILSQDNTKQKDTQQHLLTDSLEERTLSTSSLSSTNSSVSLSSFQADNLNAKTKNSSLTSSILSSDSVAVPNLSTSLDKDRFASDKEIGNTDTRLDFNVGPVSNFISRQNSGLSSSSSSSISDGVKDFFSIQHPTIEYFNNDLTVPSTSLNQQDEVLSVGTDTTFKNTSSTIPNNNKDNSDNITIPASKASLHIDNIKSGQTIGSSVADVNNQNITVSNNIHSKGTNMKQDIHLKNMDYQTLLQSYCFYTSPSSSRDSIVGYSEISPSSSPGATLFL